jgi:prevent-host-death family protein
MQSVQNVNSIWKQVVIAMEKEVGVTKARDMLRTILDEVQYRGDKYVVSRHGEPAVAIVPLEVYENWKKQRQRLLQLIQEVQSANEEYDPDEVMADVLEAQQTVRGQKE